MYVRVPLHFFGGHLYRRNRSGNSNRLVELFFFLILEAKLTVSVVFLNISPNLSILLTVNWLNIFTEMWF